ncbi:MAG: methyl-accepting chemotaxis protein [Woeseiaceae bacterium]|nr:methyl-accepting chemotaxis protein [Woeseiaceae bacterium]
MRVPGNSDRWDELLSGGQSIVDGREDIAALTQAADGVAANTPDLLAAADNLLEFTGATAAVQAVEGRALALQDAVAALPGSDRPDALASSIAEDLARLRQVSDALGGAETPLDIAPLPEAARSGPLASFNAALAAVEANAEQALDNVAAAASLRDDAAGVITAADDLRGALTGTAGASAAAFLGHPWLVPGLLGAALVLVIVLAIMHSRSAVFERAAKVQSEQNDRNQQAILRLLDELGSLADGDLTVEATVTEDITGAIADSINYAIEKLRELVATINETAIMVDSAAKQTESTAVHMARAADNQNREISAASESIVSMAASIEEVSGNAERSSDVARHSVDVAHKGGEAVRRTIDGMNAIRETIQDTSKRIKRLGESSQEIGNIIELINDIAEQTNILALNASIQASMAGEAGRGFAVVADEVQRLAERSTNATKQIEVLVRTIQADTNEAVVSMERSTTDVVGGALLAENAGAALDEIEQVSNQIASLVQNISSSAREQAGSAADVTKRTTRLKEISAQTGKATTATAAAISKLSELASQLRQTVAGFALPSAALESRNLASQKPPESRPAEDKAAG